MSSTAAVTGVPDEPPSGAGPGRQTGPALAWAGLLVVLAARMLRALLVTFLVVASIPLVTSWSGYVVRSGSMEPGLSVGDVVIARPLSADEPIPVGRVLVFHNPDRASNHTTMIHRVVQKLDSGEFVTAGDANREHDSTPVPAGDFTARPSISVPFIGLALTWWADRDLGRLIFWLTLVSIALYVSVRPPCDPRHRQRRRAGAARRAAARAASAAGRASLIVLPVGLLATAVAVAPVAQADAAFSAATSNRGMVWQASTSLSKTLVLSEPPAEVRGSVALSASLAEGSGRAFSVRIEYAPAGTVSWSTACTDTTAPYSCDWATTVVGSGAYDLRAIATAGTTTYTSQVVEDILVDNVAPTVAMQDPGTPLRGVVTTAVTASDSHSGVETVVIQYAATGSTTFKDVCTVTATPYSCRFDTSTLADGSYGFRAVVTDGVGNTTTSATVGSRVVDNSVASVSVEDPGAYLSGTVPLRANATSTAGVASVRIQYAASGSSTWTDVCSDTTSPYECSMNTGSVADGLYDLRAVMQDKLGRLTTSAVVTGRRVDNTPLRGFDVQTTNGSILAGRIATGDTMSLTYSERVTLASVASGWTGSPLAVTVRLRDGALQGLGSSDDTITVLRGAGSVNLGSVNLRQNYIGSSKSAEFAATMTTTTVTVNGVQATRVTLTLGAQTSGSTPLSVLTPSTMIWTPSALVTDLNGRAGSAAPTSETGTWDREF